MWSAIIPIITSVLGQKNAKASNTASTAFQIANLFKGQGK